jgi:hypothetical protein
MRAIGGTVNSHKRASSPVAHLSVLVGAALAQLGAASAVQAQSVAASVCPILAKLVPEVRTFKPEGARAQLVMAVAEKFEYDASALRKVKAEVDAATTTSCPKDREAMLSVLKMKSLAEAPS